MSRIVCYSPFLTSPHHASTDHDVEAFQLRRSFEKSLAMAVDINRANGNAHSVSQTAPVPKRLCSLRNHKNLLALVVRHAFTYFRWCLGITACPVLAQKPSVLLLPIVTQSIS
jgi:hypothetical protein